MNEDALERLIHDIVISSYFSTFQASELQKLGLLITQNTSANKTRFVGNPTNPIYPEIVIWKPDNQYLRSMDGKAVLVACIETRRTLGKDIFKWRFLASLGIIFNLVVEESDVATTKDLLKANNIDQFVKLQKYTYDTVNKRYVFSNVT